MKLDLLKDILEQQGTPISIEKTGERTYIFSFVPEDKGEEVKFRFETPDFFSVLDMTNTLSNTDFVKKLFNEYLFTEADNKPVGNKYRYNNSLSFDLNFICRWLCGLIANVKKKA